jgi:cytochrome c
MTRTPSLLSIIALAGADVALPAAASEQIAVKAGCAVCHSADKKLVGPTWHDVAAKYKGTADAPAKLA